MSPAPAPLYEAPPAPDNLHPSGGPETFVKSTTVEAGSDGFAGHVATIDISLLPSQNKDHISYHTLERVAITADLSADCDDC